MWICGKEVLIEGKVIKVARLDAEGYDFLDNPDEVRHTLRSCARRIDLFTFIQKLSQGEPKYRFRMEWDNMAALRVSTYDDWMKHQIDFRARNKVRKAEKNGIVVREMPFDDRLIEGISAIYNEAPIRQGKPFWHYGKEVEAVRRLNGTFLDRSIFIGALFAGRLVGFVKLVTSEDGSQAGLMQILSMIRYRDKAPTNALIAQAVQSCAERGIGYLWYANFSYGQKQQDSLADFKRHNGFQKVDVPRYYLPLTVVGQVALRLGMHHRAVDWIPEPLTARYREIRKRWYTRKYPELDKV